MVVVKSNLKSEFDCQFLVRFEIQRRIRVDDQVFDQILIVFDLILIYFYLMIDLEIKKENQMIEKVD